jgi:hypothetical protein
MFLEHQPAVAVGLSSFTFVFLEQKRIALRSGAWTEQHLRIGKYKTIRRIEIMFY